ncbi:MAG: MFS transporter [Luminiphilus sp.]
MGSLRSVSSLLLTTAFLLAGHGLHMTLLPLRAAELGMSTLLVGLSGSAYFAGFLTGALVTPRVIANVGHIRSFTALLATFLSSFLVLSLCDGGVLWIVIRFVLGAAMCGAYTVIESWLTEQTDPAAHGRVLSVYTVIVLSAMALGQYLLNLTDNNPLHPFILVSLMVGCAIIPVSLTRSPTPAPVPATRFSFSKLYRRSHTAFAGALGSGLIMGSFWSLGAVYILALTGDPAFVPWFIAANIVGGALAQYPIGLASDRVDRRYVLTLLCIGCAATALALSRATDPVTLLWCSAAFGAAGNSLYAVSLAKAADNSKRDEFVMLGSSVLLLNALGAAGGALVFGFAMRWLGNEALFIAVGCASLLFGLFIAIQPRGRTAVATAEQSEFVGTTSAMAPIALQQDPRSVETTAAEGAEDQSPDNSAQNPRSGCTMALDTSEKITAC